MYNGAVHVALTLLHLCHCVCTHTHTRSSTGTSTSTGSGTDPPLQIYQLTGGISDGIHVTDGGLMVVGP